MGSASSQIRNIAAAVSTGPYLSDPRLMPSYSIPSTSLSLLAPASSQEATQAAFFTGTTRSADRFGTDNDTNFTASVAKTIVNVSVRCLLGGIVGPTMTTAGDTTTFTITRDGVAYTASTVTAIQNGDRAYLGSIIATSAFTSDGGLAAFFASASTPAALGLNSSAATIRPMPSYNAPLGLALYCASALKVEITTSTNITGTANHERRTVVFWQKLLG